MKLTAQNPYYLRHLIKGNYTSVDIGNTNDRMVTQAGNIAINYRKL